MKLSEACEAYLSDMQARHLRDSTRKRYKSLFRSWHSYAGERGLTHLTSFDQAEMRAWRESWICKPGTQRLQLKLLRAFFTHATRAGWITTSPVEYLKAPRAPNQPTMPLSRDELVSLITAATEVNKPKEQALILLMRYSGLSICDAVTLRREAIDSHSNLTLRRAKSGELVMVLLHSLAIEALQRITRPNQTYYFWTGNSQPVTATNYWRQRLHRVASRAGVQDFRPHRLRDTFAVELLLAGVAIQEVSTLLGHSSVRTTEQYYAPWNVSRRDRLVEIMREVHACDPLPELLNRHTLKTNTGAASTAPDNSPAPLSVMRSSSI